MRRGAVGGINHVTLSCADVAGTTAFYRDVLGFDVVATWPVGAYLSAGPLWLAIVEGAAESRDADDYSHLALDVGPKEFEALVERIRASGAPQWQENWTEGDSWYFCDPEGHRLEVHATTFADRIRRCREAPWDGLELAADAEALAARPPALADRRKPRRLALAPLAVVVVVVDDAGRVLLLRHPDVGRWEAVNGSVEAGEDPADAARRELAEEAGPVAVGDLQCFAARTVDYPGVDVPLVSVGFVARFEGGDPVAGDDMAGSEVAWLDPRDLADDDVYIPTRDDLVRAVELLRR